VFHGDPLQLGFSIAAQFECAEVKSADLVVRGFKRREEEALATSDVVFNAQAHKRREPDDLHARRKGPLPVRESHEKLGALQPKGCWQT
jgi:hypothetical protein